MAENCTICGVERREHEALERAGGKHHKWTGVLGGRLEHVSPEQSRRIPTDSPRGLLQPPPGDPVLRLLLINKGIISAGELDELQNLLATAGMAVASPPRPTRDASGDRN